MRLGGAGEVEILNVAVDPGFRGQGVATALIESLQAAQVFLEVRESNTTAIGLYRRIGFEEAGKRKEYYDNPTEDAIVMRRSRPAP